MAMKETIKTGRKYRKCIDNTSGNKKWERYSFWSKASDVEFNDGTTAENKLGGFKGVTTNENQVAGYAADVTLVKSIKTALSNLITSLTNLVNSINDRLGGMRFYEDSTGKYVVGADSVPKKLGSGMELIAHIHHTRYKNIEVNENGTYRYGHISEFDLTRIPNYQSLKLGEDVIVEISVLNSSQIHSYNTWISKEDQFNINEFNYNAVKITDFNAVRDIEVWTPSGTGYHWRDSFARYVPSTGKLYIILGSTAKAYTIALYRI